MKMPPPLMLFGIAVVLYFIFMKSKKSAGSPVYQKPPEIWHQTEDDGYRTDDRN